jgi:hypothetical protein
MVIWAWVGLIGRGAQERKVPRGCWAGLWGTASEEAGNEYALLGLWSTPSAEPENEYVLGGWPPSLRGSCMACHCQLVATPAPNFCPWPPAHPLLPRPRRFCRPPTLWPRWRGPTRPTRAAPCPRASCRWTCGASSPRVRTPRSPNLFQFPVHKRTAVRASMLFNWDAWSLPSPRFGAAWMPR